MALHSLVDANVAVGLAGLQVEYQNLDLNLKAFVEAIKSENQFFSAAKI